MVGPRTYNRHVANPAYRGALQGNDESTLVQVANLERQLEQTLASFLDKPSSGRIDAPDQVHVMLGTEIPGITPVVGDGQVTLTIHFPPKTSHDIVKRYQNAMERVYTHQNPLKWDNMPRVTAMPADAPYALELTFNNMTAMTHFFTALAPQSMRAASR